MRSPVRDMTRHALMTALICVTAPLQIPLGAVPLTLQTFVITLSGAMLGAKRGCASAIAYVLLGAVGLPVFTGFSGGLGALLGPTGGFLIGFPLLAAFCGMLRGRPMPLQILCGVFGLLLMDAIGTLHLMNVADMGLSAALIAGVWPFLAKDIACVALGCIAARKISARLRI